MLTGFRSPSLVRCSATAIGWLTNPQPGGVAATSAGWDADDWQAARWAIQVHGIAALLDRAFEHSREAGVLPGWLRAYLAEQRRLSGLRVARLLDELAAILELAERHGIMVAPLKGSLLASSYYAEPGLRPMNDLDLLVRPADERRMLEALSELGYHVVARGWKHVALAHPDRSGPTVSYEGEHPDNPRSVELHVRAAEQFWGIRYDLTDQIWGNSAPGRIWGGAAQVMDPVALLHHLAVHASSDAIARRLRLLHLHDIALVAARVDRAGWAQIVHAAERRREQRLVYPAVLLASRYYSVIPAEVLERLRPGVPAALLRHLDASDLDQLSYCNTAPTSPADKLCWFRPGRERIGAVRHMLLPDPSEIAHWFPHLARPALLPLAYARYGAQLASWGMRRALGKPRMMLR